MTIRAAWLCTICLSVRRTRCLDLPLSVSAVLLRTRTGVLCRTVCVTVRCRCRLLESSVLCLLIGALSFRGSVWTKLTVPVVLVVVTTVLWSVWLLYVQVTPPVMALLKRMALRLMKVTRWCRLVSWTCLTGALLSRTWLLLGLQKCGSNWMSEDPLSLEWLMTVMIWLGLVMNEMFCSVGLWVVLQCRRMLLNLTWLCVWVMGLALVLILVGALSSWNTVLVVEMLCRTTDRMPATCPSEGSTVTTVATSEMNLLVPRCLVTVLQFVS